MYFRSGSKVRVKSPLAFISTTYSTSCDCASQSVNSARSFRCPPHDFVAAVDPVDVGIIDCDAIMPELIGGDGNGLAAVNRDLHHSACEHIRPVDVGLVNCDAVSQARSTGEDPQKVAAADWHLRDL